MADTYLPGLAGYQHNNDTDTTNQQNELYKALLAQTMQQGPSTGAGGIIAKMLGTYSSMQGAQQQPYSTDPTSASFMGPPTSMMNGFGGS